MLKKVCPLIALSLVLTHCGKDSDSKKEPKAPTSVSPTAPVSPTEPATQLTENHPLLGTWLTCQPMDFESNEKKSMKAKVEFLQDGSHLMTVTPFQDGDCKTAYTPEAIELEIAKIEAFITGFGGEMSPEEKAEIRDGFKTQNFKGTYKAGLPNAEGVGTLDLVSVEGEKVQNTFESYKIAGDELSLTDSCTAEDIVEETCTVEAGTRPENRATVFDDEMVFKKQK